MKIVWCAALRAQVAHAQVADKMWAKPIIGWTKNGDEHRIEGEKSLCIIGAVKVSKELKLTQRIQY